MPAMGLLKIARHLKEKNVDVQYIDFSIPMRLADTNISLKKAFDAPFNRYVECGNYASENIVKPQKYYGASHSNIRNAIRLANPTEIWLSTSLTYYWESARDVANICKSEFPDVPLLVGGIYATLYPEHCQTHLPADYVHVGPMDDIDDILPDYSVDGNRFYSTTRTIQLGKGCNVNPPCSFCFMPGTSIFTERGVKSIENLRVNDRLSMFKGHDKVVAVSERNYSGDMYSIKVERSNIPLVVTKDHEIAINGVKIPAESLTPGMKIRMPVSRGLENMHDYSTQTSRLQGYYVAEGHIGFDRKNEPVSVVFTFNRNETQFHDDVYWLVKSQFNKECWKTDTGTAVQIGFSDKSIAKEFHDTCGSGSANKRIPWSIWKSPSLDHICEFIKGCWRGDGSIFMSSNSWRASYTTISEELAHQMWWMLMRIGLNPQIQKDKNTTDKICGRKVNCSEYRYQVNLFRQAEVAVFADQLMEDPIYSWKESSGPSDIEVEYIRKVYRESSRGWVKKFREVSGWSKNNWFYHRTKDISPVDIRLLTSVELPICSVERFHYEGKVYNCTVEPSHLVTTSIGMIDQCSVVAMDPKFKAIAAGEVFKYIKQEYKRGVNFFRFWSSQLLVPKSRFIALMESIIESDMKLSLIASEGVQPSLFDQNISDLMKKAGFSSVAIPMESIDDAMNTDFRKPSDFSDYERSVMYAQNSGFESIRSFVMLGVPGQSYDQMVRAIVDCWARDVTPGLHQYTPIPGSYDWTRYPQFHTVSPERLHPSLWPAATDDMKVSHMEEIKKIAGIGRKNMLKYQNTSAQRVPEIWDLYIKWCKHYSLMDGDQMNNLSPLAVKGYESACKKNLESNNQCSQISREESLTQCDLSVA